MKFVSIAVDGPSGAGKSTMARKLAERLGYLYVDTGAIYRTVALCALQSGTDPADSAQIEHLLGQVLVELKHGPDGLQHMYLNGRDVTDEIRQPRISKAASQVSAVPAVRAFLLSMQRSLAETKNVIMDGRDIGTVVLPGADVKIFLTASVEERATRRFKELQARGMGDDYETVLRDIVQRDHDDSTRSTAPLRQAEDAVLVDTTGVSFEGSLELLIAAVRRTQNT